LEGARIRSHHETDTITTSLVPKNYDTLTSPAGVTSSAKLRRAHNPKAPTAGQYTAAITPLMPEVDCAYQGEKEVDHR